MRIIIDTNLWISYLIFNRLIQIDLLIETRAVRLVFSEELLQEFVGVAMRPKFRKIFSGEDIEALLELFEAFGELVEVVSEVEVCRDPKDNFLLALAKDSGADYLITGDQDVLVLDRFEQTNIVTFTEFIELIG
ncbi:MAG: putative toxin-antitoxin system toxin component, PIN family [Bacteroidota bacterium]